LPLPTRCGVIGGALLGGIGLVLGFVIGLFVYAPTAAFAALELGIPATVVGEVVGFTVGGLVALGRRMKQREPRR
jgi:hypothetical protein